MSHGYSSSATPSLPSLANMHQGQRRLPSIKSLNISPYLSSPNQDAGPPPSAPSSGSVSGGASSARTENGVWSQRSAVPASMRPLPSSLSAGPAQDASPRLDHPGQSSRHAGLSMYAQPHGPPPPVQTQPAHPPPTSREEAARRRPDGSMHVPPARPPIQTAYPPQHMYGAPGNYAQSPPTPFSHSLPAQPGAPSPAMNTAGYGYPLYPPPGAPSRQEMPPPGIPPMQHPAQVSHSYYMPPQQDGHWRPQVHTQDRRAQHQSHHMGPASQPQRASPHSANAPSPAQPPHGSALPPVQPHPPALAQPHPPLPPVQQHMSTLPPVQPHPQSLPPVQPHPSTLPPVQSYFSPHPSVPPQHNSSVEAGHIQGPPPYHTQPQHSPETSYPPPHPRPGQEYHPEYYRSVSGPGLSQAPPSGPAQPPPPPRPASGRRTEPVSSMQSQERQDTITKMVQHSEALLEFAARFSKSANTQPTPAELLEMKERAEQVVKLIETLRAMDQATSAPASGPPATPQQLSTSVAPGSTTSSRGRKRPWEEMSADEPASAASGSRPAQRAASSAAAASGSHEPNSGAADADMELIRTKRANAAASASASHGKSKYRKRSRASPPGECHSCHIRETPEWRRGPNGARTLCNACGLHFAKLMKKHDKAVEAGLAPEPVDMAMLQASTARARLEAAQNGKAPADGAPAPEARGSPSGDVAMSVTPTPPLNGGPSGVNGHAYAREEQPPTLPPMLSPPASARSPPAKRARERGPASGPGPSKPFPGPGQVPNQAHGHGAPAGPSPVQSHARAPGLAQWGMHAPPTPLSMAPRPPPGARQDPFVNHTGPQPGRR